MTRALVIGCGVAGPVTAMALQRAGIEPVVCESRSGTVPDAGTYLTVAVNGMSALRAIDAHEPVLRHGFPSTGIVFSTGTGRELGRVPIGEPLPGGVATQTVKRADLNVALRGEAERRGVPVHFGAALTGVDMLSDGVRARFADGTVREADLLIGCDGVHSVVRRMIDPHAPAVRYTGLLNVGGFTRDLPVAGEPGTYRMIFGRHAFFGYTVSPDGEVWWFANPGSTTELDSALLDDRASAYWKQRLGRVFAADRTPATSIIAATTGPLVASNSYDLPMAPRWSRGRAIVLGDAAHAASPASGQGASMAVEDAVVLAKCLRDVPGIEPAFATYEALRRSRVESVVAQGERSGRMKAVGPVARFVRDRKLPRILARHASGSGPLAALFDHRIYWDEKVAPATVSAG